MARSDLLVSLVRAGASGDSRELATTVEAIIAEERAKQHNILADRLERALRSNGKGGPSAHTVPDSAVRARDYVLETMPRKRLEDLFLPELCERACRELIEEQQRASLLRSHSLEPRHRVLLVGPPGNGKTSLAEAIAEALAVPFFVVRYDAIIGSFLGETASRLRRVFDYARTTPCVLFFDEFDAVGKERGDENETGEIKRVVTSLLMQVDALPSYTVVIAASNHSELLDRAVWRRFQFRLELPAPTAAQVGRYFEAFAKRMDGPLGLGPNTIAKSLGEISYAEPNPCRERWRHSSPRPPPPQRAGRLRLGLQQFHLHDQLPDPLHGDVQFRLHRIALAFLERGIDPGDRLLTPLLEPENLHAQLPRQKFHRLATQKPQGNLTLARHRPPLAKSQRACRRNLARGKRGRAKLALVYHRPINSNFVLKIVGHVPVLLGHFD